jgi:hypothetical protein
LQNECLLLKFLDIFLNKKDVPWVHLVWESYYDSAFPPAKFRDCSFWWRDCLKLLPKFKEISTSPLKNGSTIKVWTDTSHDQPLHHSLPHLASFAKTLETSVQQALLLEDLSDLFHLPLTEAAYLEYITLSDLLQSFDSVDESDIWSYPWGVNYSVSKAYAFFMNLKYPSPLHPTFSWLWKSCYQQNTESSAGCSSKTD